MNAGDIPTPRPVRAPLPAGAASLLALLSLRRSVRLGRGARLAGRPWIENYGRIEAGERFSLNSQPVRSHLVAGARALIRIGDDVAIDYGAAVASEVRIEIGNRVRIGPFVMIMDTDFHQVADRSRRPEAGPIRIGDDIRIGSRVTILPDAAIGDGARVLSGSVVAGPVPPGAMVSGVPARPALPRGESGAGGESAPLEERVRRVVAATFALPELPSLAGGPESIAAWDSLGTLRLILELEDEFAVSLPPDDLLGARTVQDLVGLVNSKKQCW
jgi:maltose O-acetyltransferase